MIEQEAFDAQRRVREHHVLAEDEALPGARAAGGVAEDEASVAKARWLRGPLAGDGEPRNELSKRVGPGLIELPPGVWPAAEDVELDDQLITTDRPA